jgi:Mlc titration factor MtfA (ptsG expression regulator)
VICHPSIKNQSCHCTEPSSTTPPSTVHIDFSLDVSSDHFISSASFQLHSAFTVIIIIISVILCLLLFVCGGWFYKKYKPVLLTPTVLRMNEIAEC